MIKSSDYLKFLDCNNYLREHLNVFIEAFVKYYGEERRGEIEEKFNNTLIIAYQRPYDKKMLITKAKEEKSLELIESIMKENKWNLKREDLFDTTKTYEYKENMPIDNYSLFLNLYQYKKSNNLEELIENNFIHAKKIVPTLTKEEYLEMIQTRNVLPKYENLDYSKMRRFLSILDINHIDELYERTKKKALSLLNKIDSSITLENLEEYMKDERVIGLNYLSKIYEKTLEEYYNFTKDFTKFEEEINEVLKKEEQLKTRLYQEYIEENKDFVPQNKQDGMDEFLKDPTKTYELNSDLRTILGYSIHTTALLNAFTEESNDILKDSNASNWKKESIKSDRVKYFQIWGINLGNTYENYLESEEVKRIWPLKERMEKYQESLKRIQEEYDKEFFYQSDFYQKTKEEIKEKSFLDKDDFFDENLYKSSNNTFVSQNVTKKEDHYESSCMVIINMDNYSDRYRDHFIVHELNHLLESYLQSANKYSYTTLCGWDISDTKLEKNEEDFQKEDDKKRKYELMNEIINEVIAQEISKTMKENHMGVFESSEDAKYQYGTSYEYTMFLIKDFYKEFREDILKSRINGNMDHILEVVGEENFEDLNHLFEIFFENYSGFKIYRILDDIKNNRQTEESKIYFELMDEKDKILERMKQRKKEKMEEITK